MQGLRRPEARKKCFKCAGVHIVASPVAEFALIPYSSAAPKVSESGSKVIVGKQLALWNKGSW